MGKLMVVFMLGLLMLFFNFGCAARFSVPTVDVGVEAEGVEVEEGENITAQFDDPVQGWYIQGHVGLNGVWVAPFWTTDVVVLGTMIDGGWYIGPHLGYWQGHRGMMHYGHGGYRHHGHGRDGHHGRSGHGNKGHGNKGHGGGNKGHGKGHSGGGHSGGHSGGGHSGGHSGSGQHRR